MADKQNPKGSKKPKEPSVLDIARELEAQQERIREEQQEIARQQYEEERSAHAEQLRKDKVELIRLKQGVIEESDTIYEEHPEERKFTLREKISNFFYHNKWWLGIASFFAFIIGFITWQIVTTVKPDMIVLLLVHDDFFNAACNERIGELFSQYIADENGDGRVAVDVYYIPASADTADRSGYTGDSTKLFAEFQISEAVLVISDEGADEFIVPDQTLYSLEEDFGDYAQTDGVRFYLSDTGFADALEWDEGPLDKDIYIGIRKVRKTLDSEKEMQKVFDVSYPALRQFIVQFGTKSE